MSRTLKRTKAKQNPVFHTYSSMYSKLIPQAICEQTQPSLCKTLIFRGTKNSCSLVTNNTLHTNTFRP